MCGFAWLDNRKLLICPTDIELVLKIFDRPAGRTLYSNSRPRSSMGFTRPEWKRVHALFLQVLMSTIDTENLTRSKGRQLSAARQHFSDLPSDESFATFPRQRRISRPPLVDGASKIIWP